MIKMQIPANINIYTILNVIKTKFAMHALMLMATIGLHAGYHISGTLEHTAGSSITDAAFAGALKGEKSSIKIVSKTKQDTTMIDEWYQNKDQVLHAKLFMKPDTPPDYHGYAYEKDVFRLGEPFGQLVYVYIQGFLRGDTRNCQKVLSEFASFQVNQELIRITRVVWIEREDGAVNGAIVYAISPIVKTGKREFVAGNLTASRDAAS